jgi:hypothetical protein
MAFEFNENSGSLFPRVDKDNDRQPDATGRCKIDGRQNRGLEARERFRPSLAFTRRKAPKSRNRSSRPRNRNKASLLMRRCMKRVVAFQPFIESRMPTEGFERASADFEQCLAQLELIAR